MRRRLLTLALLSAFVAADVTVLAGAAPAAPDPTFPTGTFTIPETTQYVQSNGWDYESAIVPLVRVSLSDDTTPADQIAVRIYSGSDLGRSDDGRPAFFDGANRDRINYGYGLDEDMFEWFDLAGTYQPYVTLTDKDGNTTRIDLPTVTLLDDRTPPATRLTLPRKSRRNTMMAWRYIRGTVVDAGVDRPGSYGGGGAYAQIEILQKRRGYWYYYQCYTPDPSKQRTWCKGKPTLGATLKHFKYGIGISTKSVGETGWRTPYVKGLTRSPLAIVVHGADSNFNYSKPRVYTGFKITRRR